MICPECGAKNLPHAEVCASCDLALPVDGEEEVDPLIGRELAGKYVLGDIIGEGSMGCVYAAYQTDLEREIAIKVLHPHVAADPKVAKRFHREARTASRLSHPNSLQIFDFGKEDGGKLLYIAMELLDGPDLLDIITDESPLSPKRIGALVGGVLLALEEAHDIGVIHRDLKPENIMVVRDHQNVEHVKVCDFGIAKLVEAEGSAITVTGFVCGTPEYMAPEQARGEGLDGRADLYAIGCLLYHLIAGKPPFVGPSALGTITKHLTEPVEPLRKRRPDLHVPRSLERVCMRALAKDRDNRFADAASMRRALDRAVEGLGELAEAPLGTHREDPTATLPPPPSRGRWAAPLLTLTGTVCVVLAAIWAIGDSGGGGVDAGGIASEADASPDSGDDLVDASVQDAGEDVGAPDTGVPDVGPDTSARVRPGMGMGMASEMNSETNPDTVEVTMEPPSPGREAFEDGRRRFLEGDVPGAIRSFERARAAMPRSANVHKELGRAYMRSGDVTRARGAYTRYLELAPNAPDRALVEQILGRP